MKQASRKLISLFPLIESALVISYFFPIWGIIPGKTIIFKIDLFHVFNRLGLTLAIITFLISAIYHVLSRIKKRPLTFLNNISWILALLLLPFFIIFSYLIFLIEITFPRQK